MNGIVNEISDSNKLKISIIGGGLVGSLAALHLAKAGHNIYLYEYREDIRKCELVQGRSINLALSVRGRAALAEVGLENELLQHGIPMKGRMLHSLNGEKTIVPYDAGRKQCIYSVGRKYLNEILLNATEKYSNIHLNFNRKLIKANLDEGKIFLKNPKTNEEFEDISDLIIGCDGAFSAVRSQMIKHPGFNFSQTYIEHGYIELCIPPKNDDFAMPHNFLHIWPRGEFMMIALPNQDKTWTVTLFMPFENFHNLKNSNDLIKFFEKYFPDAIDLIGEKRLINDFFKVKPQYLVSIKCKPYNYESKALLLGDAAHAMVPFYGQGMNAGFEDCSILSSIMKTYSIHMNLEKILNEFSEKRWEDAHSICDLAMYNYLEMRHLVTKKSYRIRKAFDDFLYRFMPNYWIPLYNTVSFSRMPYKKCIKNREWQDKILKLIGYIITCGTLFGFSLAILKNYHTFTDISYLLNLIEIKYE